MTVWKNGYMAVFAFWSILDGVSGKFETDCQLELKSSLVFSHLHKDLHGILLSIDIQDPKSAR